MGATASLKRIQITVSFYRYMHAFAGPLQKMITAAEDALKEVERAKVVTSEEPVVENTKTNDAPNEQPGRYSL